MSRPLADLLSYVRPVFFAPAVAMSVYGGLLAPASDINSGAGALHACLVGLTLFVAHLQDGYVDGHRRGEETPRLGAAEFRRAISLGSVGVVGLAGVLHWLAGSIAALSVVVLLALALFHAPYLDRNPVTVTVDYPVGIGVVLLGGYATQTRGVALPILGVAAAFVGLLSGIKIGIDRLDARFDRSIGKRTIPVAHGTGGATQVAATVFVVTALTTAAIVGSVAVRPGAVVGAVGVPIACLLATATLPPARAVRVQMGLTYVFAALVFGSVCDGCAGLGVVGGLFDGRFGLGWSFVVGNP